MTRFSERKGFKKVRETLQVDSIDDELLNRLWNILDFYYWRGMGRYRAEMVGDEKILFTKLWHYFFKEPVDDLDFRWEYDLDKLKERFFDFEWYEVYDFVEFVASAYPNDVINEKFMKTCNDVLEAELSAYRFIGGKIAEITSKEEISEIEEALSSSYKTVSTHLENALRLMSDKQNPDYRNSIKESISAVEATCNLLAGKKITLGQCLKDMREKVGLHGALEKAFSSLYGYTSEAEGIRHALLEESTLSFEDAKFMLVSCSAFVNYLKSKASKAGLTIG